MRRIWLASWVLRATALDRLADKTLAALADPYRFISASCREATPTSSPHDYF